MSATENPTYVTIVNLPGTTIHRVNLMEWDARADDYTVGHSWPTPNRAAAEELATTIAKKEGVEIR